MPILDLVYNPVAGSFSPGRFARLEAALRDAEFDVRSLPTRAEGTQLSGEADLVCVHGGDGTLRDTVRAMGDDAGRTPLCIAPSGTVNLVARELGYARKAEVFAGQIADGWAKGEAGWLQAPLYLLGDTPIVSCMSIGPDSHAVARVSGALKRRIGRYAYLVALMRQMREWPRDPMHVTGTRVNGEDFAVEAEAVIVSNAALYAGPFRMSARAGLHTDCVELVSVRECTRARMIALAAASLLRLPVERIAGVEVRSCTRIAFDRCAMPVQVDGDHMPECAFAIQPSGLTLRYVV